MGMVIVSEKETQTHLAVSNEIIPSEMNERHLAELLVTVCKRENRGASMYRFTTEDTPGMGNLAQDSFHPCNVSQSPRRRLEKRLRADALRLLHS